MRARGQIRGVLASAASALYQQMGRGVTWRELALHSQVGWGAARNTVRNMERSRELVSVGFLQVEGVNRPMRCYAPPAAAAAPEPRLDHVVTGWARFD